MGDWEWFQPRSAEILKDAPHRKTGAVPPGLPKAVDGDIHAVQSIEPPDSPLIPPKLVWRKITLTKRMGYG